MQKVQQLIYKISYLSALVTLWIRMGNVKLYKILSSKDEGDNMDDSYEEVVSRIEEYRKSNKFSQAEMAEKLGLTQSHYSKIEKGTKSITNDVLLKMHKIGMDMDYIITGMKKETSEIDVMVDGCQTDRKLNFFNIVILYINMILKSKNKKELNCKNEFQIMEYNIRKSNGAEVGTVWTSIRNARGITQKKMASILEIDVKTYRNIEKGISMPTAEVLMKLYKKLGYYPTLMQDTDTNYLLVINGVWNGLEDDEKLKVEEIIGYSLNYINEKFV